MQDKPESFKILAVDDNPTNIKVIGNVLHDAGYRVGFALNGREALEVLMEVTDYDLVLMDINMPEIDGFEALELMQQCDECKKIPVIMLTAFNNVENIVRGFDLGAVDYITKPFHSKELLSRVNTHLQLKRKSDQLETYTKELELINATKDKFFSIISHDLRNPIGSLQIISKMLRASIDKNDQIQITELLDVLDSTVGLGSKLLENLLQWARSQTGRIIVKPMELQLAALVDDVLELVEAQAVGKNISFTNAVPEAQVVYADRDLLKTILRNLLNNAVKYCKPNEGKISVLAHTSPKGVSIQISDNGIGMDVQTQAKLFRIDGNITSMPGTHGEEGTGLGLILCKEFTEKMGGSVSVLSKPDKGSTFTISLPQTEQVSQ
ncbi:MAG: hybrid sensor histidine kinase/response regulator [Bacteroidetes bacterium]|nr:MAG: hybrid sensor histidine kinase/response regulator [Bacteroidota bacterium]